MRIVEGSKRSGDEFRRAIDSAEASLAETEYLLIACRDLRYLQSTVTDPLIRTAPRIAQRLVTLRSFTTDIIALQRAMPDVSELGDVLLESGLNLKTGEAVAPRPSIRSRRATKPPTSKPAAVANRSARARKASAAPSRRGGR
jgi:hypothetical protein